MTEKKPIKLNLGAMKGDSNIEKENQNNEKNIYIQTNKVGIGKIDISKMVEKKQEEGTKKLGIEGIKDEKKDRKIVSDKIEATRISIPEQKIEKEKSENIVIKEEKKIYTNKIQKQEKKDDNEGDIFTNYKSEFHKESNKMVEKIKKIGTYIKPKTRLGFILILVTLALLGITILFIISPEIHNFRNYRNNMIKATSTIICKIDESKCIISDEDYEKQQIEENRLKSKNNIVNNNENIIIPEINNDEPGINEKEEQNNKENIEETKKETMSKGGFIIEYKVKKLGDIEIILYNGKEYDNIEEFNKNVDIDIKNKKINKLKNFINNKDKQ